jgi:CheY-like chemotaxis protein
MPVQPAAKLMSRPRATAAAGRLSGRILVAEDALDMQRLISLLLTRAGAEVVVASNGAIAVEMASTQRFDLILMDMQMSQLDGHGAATELRSRGINTPIIALTANAMSGDRARCLAAGCDDYLAKPIDRVVLLARVQDYLHGYRTSKAATAAKVA